MSNQFDPKNERDRVRRRKSKKKIVDKILGCKEAAT